MNAAILTFLYNNWQDFIVDLVVGLVVGLVLGMLFHILSKRRTISAESERVKQAKNSLLDILEARIINKKNITVDKINNLLKAIEREYSIIFSDAIFLSSLLQDLELRFEKNNYLDPAQKEEYCELIQNQIHEIETTEESSIIPNKYSEIIETLTEEIKSKNTDKSLEILEILNKKIRVREEYLAGPRTITIPTIYMAFFISLFYFVLKLFNVGFFDAILICFMIVAIILILDSVTRELLNIVIKKIK